MRSLRIVEAPCACVIMMASRSGLIFNKATTAPINTAQAPIRAVSSVTFNPVAP